MRMATKQQLRNSVARFEVYHGNEGLEITCDCGFEALAENIHTANLLNVLDKVLAHRTECRFWKPS